MLPPLVEFLTNKGGFATALVLNPLRINKEEGVEGAETGLFGTSIPSWCRQ
jgi:hypothetical protein